MVIASIAQGAPVRVTCGVRPQNDKATNAGGSTLGRYDVGPRMPLRDLLSISFLIGTLVIAPLGAASPYFLVTPGGTYDIGSRLQIPDEHRQPIGRMAFTAVFEQEATWTEIARARIAGRAEVVPAVYIRPPGTTQEQINTNNRRLIDESKPIAAFVALKAAGFPVAITGQGARVESIVDGMPARGVLRVGDVIVAADGQPVQTTDSLIAAVRLHEVGDTVTLEVHRNDQDQTFEVGTRDSPNEPGIPIVGVTVSTYLFDVRLPFPVDIKSDNVGGPSAGFMFALGILAAATTGDLTRGYYVAGTGTITQDGTVGAVGGAAEKALAAEQDGAQIFLVPKDDAAEAHRWVHNIQIVPVDQFEDAIHALCELQPLPTALSPDPPSPCAS
jgi:PDZ domain-containing protein